MFHYVRFHADGGCACVDGLRRFGRKEVAEAFAEVMRDEPGHNCGSGIIELFSTSELIEEEGIIRLKERAIYEDWFKKCLAYTTNKPRRFQRD